MDVLVTSFNRAYSLDRCLSSLEHFARGVGRVTILDDGTPEKFLHAIERRHPGVEILTSDRYYLNSQRVADPSAAPSADELARAIPVRFWRENVERASAQFLLIEDDMWLVTELDLNALAEAMRDLDFVTVRLALFGNDAVFHGRRTTYPAYAVMEAVPTFLRRARASRFYRRWLRLQCKIAYQRVSASSARRIAFNVACVLGIVDRRLEPQYLRTLYAVAGCAFDRDFWLHCWNAEQRYVWEFTQLDAALDYALQHPGARFGALFDDAYRTSYTSSATNRWPELGCDMNAFNRAMNEAWLRGALDGAFDDEFDLDDDLVMAILAQRADPTCPPVSWRAWAERNRDLFRGLGYVIDDQRPRRRDRIAS